MTTSCHEIANKRVFMLVSEYEAKNFRIFNTNVKNKRRLFVILKFQNLCNITRYVYQHTHNK